METHKKVQPHCEKCKRLITEADRSVIFCDPDVLPEFYHLSCFFKSIGKILQKYLKQKFKPPVEQKRLPFIWDKHLCEKCFRMMDPAKDKIYTRSEKGNIVRRHQVCPPLKETYVPIKEDDLDAL